MTESELLFINEGTVTSEILDEDQIEELLGDQKENEVPPREVEEFESNVVRRLKNEEDISDSLKSLDGSVLDNEKINERTQSLENEESLQTLKATDADDEQSLKHPEEAQGLAETNKDILSASDIHMKDGVKKAEDDEQRLLQAQASYNLSSLNYNTNRQKSIQDSGSDSGLFERTNCKCEEISRNPKNKTKTCSIL